MSAIDVLIADFQAFEGSAQAAPLIAPYADMIAALNFIAAGLAPAGAETANTFFAGPTVAPAALPTFRALVNADLPVGLTPSITSLELAAGGVLDWKTRSQITSPADGQLLLRNAAGTDFARLQLGGTTAAFPAIKRVATAAAFRLSDDSADAPITAASLALGGAAIGADALAVTGTATLAGTVVGGAASSFSLINSAASNVVPTLVPNKAAATTGIGAQAAGNLSVIVAGVEVGRWTATGLNNAAVGATTPSTGAFTTLSATGLISPTSTIGILGTAANDQPQAGSVGEEISSNVAPAGAGITTLTPADVTSIVLTAGDWDVMGVVGFQTAATTSITQLIGWMSTVSATLPQPGITNGMVQEDYAAFVFGAANFIKALGTIRIQAATTVFLSVRATFTVSTLTAFGYIKARRRR